MAKPFPQAVHSYATTLPNNIVCGTNVGFSVNFPPTGLVGRCHDR
jgi:hypothetical protein